MIHVVGGTYREVCREPQWDHLFGSGLRAAAALRELSPDVRLSTYIAAADRPTLDAYALEYRIATHITEVNETVAFSYAHGLATPWVHPPMHLLAQAEPLRVDAPVVLRYGILEGDAIVRATYAVHDPQSAHNPRPFGENGSIADHVAVVANLREGRMLTGKQHTDAIGRALLRGGNEIAILKRGAAGVRVFDDTSTTDVPAFRTDRVFPIGSGDVFSAVFAHCWAELHMPASEAAYEASQATAWYCATKRLPVPESTHRVSTVRGPVRHREPDGGAPCVYLAGPFFTTAQRWLIEQARDGLLQQGLRVFSPYHDVGIGAAEEVAQADIVGLESSAAIFAIIEGFDAGTLFEVGYARSRDIPVVAFVENAPPEPLKMLVGTECEIVDDFVTAVYRTAWAAFK